MPAKWNRRVRSRPQHGDVSANDPRILREAGHLRRVRHKARGLGLRMPSVLLGNKLPVCGENFPFRERSEQQLGLKDGAAIRTWHALC